MHGALRKPPLAILGLARRTVDAPRQERGRAACVRPDEANVRAAHRGPAEQHAEHGPRRVGPVFHDSGRHVGDQILAAVRRGRMNVNHRLAAVELVHDRRIGGIAEPGVAVAGHEVRAIGFEHIEGVFDLLQRRIHVGQRQRGEQAKSRRVLLDQLRPELVAGAGNPPRDLDVAEPEARVGDGNRRRRDAAFVHILDRTCRRPVGVRRLQELAAFDFRDPLRRREVMVNVNPVGFDRTLALRDRRCERAAAGEGGGADAAGQQGSPIHPRG